MQDKHKTLAIRYGVSLEAVQILAQALRSGGGKMAQFSHPDLGGSGQWMPGMVMIGDMFNTALKARVDGLASELANLTASDRTGAMSRDAWWPSGLGTPDAHAGQNDLRYAYFAGQHRLVIEYAGQQTVYDTTGHQIIGVSQQQANGVHVIYFHSPRGLVDVKTLPIIG
jgi:hypothetical protein